MYGREEDTVRDLVHPVHKLTQGYKPKNSTFTSIFQCQEKRTLSRQHLAPQSLSLSDRVQTHPSIFCTYTHIPKTDLAI